MSRTINWTTSVGLERCPACGQRAQDDLSSSTPPEQPTKIPRECANGHVWIVAESTPPAGTSPHRWFTRRTRQKATNHLADHDG